MDVEHERPEFYEALGRTVQVLRTDQGLDRKDLADRAGISYSYLAAIENGRKPPSSKVLLSIATALGLLGHELLASVETRLRRHHPAVAAQARAPGAAPSWFHADSAPAPHAAARRAASPEWPEQADATVAGRASKAPPVPYSPAGFLMELERLNTLLNDHDRDLVLGLARRLAETE